MVGKDSTFPIYFKEENAMPKKEYKTGDVIKLNEKEIEVLATFTKEQNNLSVMFEMLAAKQSDCHKRFWDTIRGLYPGIKEFDLYGNWKKQEITLRGEKRE